MALQLFNLFPEPAFFIDRQQVCHYNRSASELLPQFAFSKRLPEKITDALSAHDMKNGGKVHILNEEFFVSMQDSEEGRLIFLHRLDEQLKQSDLGRITSKLRDQITGLAAVIQRLTAEPDVLNYEKYEQYLAMADQSIHRMLRMIDHLEIMEHPDHAMFHPAPMDLAGLYACVGRQVEDVCREAGRFFSYELEMDSLLTIGDSALLERMLLCLISNAIEASEPSESFGFRLSRRGERAILTVWDNGAGAGKMESVFVSQPDLPTLKSGLGLGLPVVRRIADLHGGTIMLEAGPGNGMRAVVSLPVRENMGRLPLHAPSGKRWDSHSGFLPVMVELSEVLPASLYRAEDDL
jgi:signal transduction histidine kinase